VECKTPREDFCGYTGKAFKYLSYHPTPLPEKEFVNFMPTVSIIEIMLATYFYIDFSCVTKTIASGKKFEFARIWF